MLWRVKLQKNAETISVGLYAVQKGKSGVNLRVKRLLKKKVRQIQNNAGPSAPLLLATVSARAAVRHNRCPISGPPTKTSRQQLRLFPA